MQTNEALHFIIDPFSIHTTAVNGNPWFAGQGVAFSLGTINLRIVNMDHANAGVKGVAMFRDPLCN